MTSPTPSSAGSSASSAAAAAPARQRTPVPGAGHHGNHEANEAHGHGHGDVTGKKLLALGLGAVGVVFGDIGTSPLYTLKECAHVLHAHVGGDNGITHNEILQLLSLIFWSMTMVVTIKYVTFIMRADNRGEGGIMALGALLPERWRADPRRPLTALAVLVVIGSAALYGDGVITPAISVLSAIEGLTLARPDLPQWLIVGLTVVVLLGLFGIQSKGTALLGALFGPVMAVWFLTLAVTGTYQIAQEPSILQALSPHHALAYFQDHGPRGFVILGSVVLAVTGGEALYADMGHFGARPIRLAWLAFVMPSLALSYFGQGALLLRHPEAAENPFFAMVPTGNWTYALVFLSSAATVVASQALISGAYSLTKQAMQMGLFPRVTVKHTDEEEKGQIYIPEVNSLLAVGCVALVLAFRSSSGLAAAYGLAVTVTMLVTSIIYLAVLVTVRGWKKWQAIALFLLFVSFDLPFLAANMLKLVDGAYVALLLAAGVMLVMLIWHQGRWQLFQHYTDRFVSFDDAWPELEKEIAQRTPGTGIFMAASDSGLPPILAHHVKRTHALHKQILLVTVVTAEQPKVEKRDRLKIDTLGHGFHRVHIHFGFMEQPNVPRALNLAIVRRDLDFDLEEVTYYLARERVLAGPGGSMGVLPEKIFGFLNRNATNADRYFQIPNGQVIEVGTLVDL